MHAGDRRTWSRAPDVPRREVTPRCGPSHPSRSRPHVEIAGPNGLRTNDDGVHWMPSMAVMLKKCVRVLYTNFGHTGGGELLV